MGTCMGLLSQKRCLRCLQGSLCCKGQERRAAEDLAAPLQDGMQEGMVHADARKGVPGSDRWLGWSHTSACTASSAA